MKQKVVKGLLWKLLKNGGAQGVQFVIAIILARLLTPAQYGVVGIITIFITIANVVVQSGFSTALVLSLIHISILLARRKESCSRCCFTVS